MSPIVKNMQQTTRFAMVLRGHSGIGEEYVLLRAIRRRAGRSYRRTGSVAKYQKAQKIHDLMRKQLQRLGKSDGGRFASC